MDDASICKWILGDLGENIMEDEMRSQIDVWKCIICMVNQ